MTAKGKVNTINLRGGDRIMVVDGGTVVDGVLLTRESPTKVKGAIPMTVYAVESKRIGPRQRLAYDIRGVGADGTKMLVRGASGNQTFWLAKA
jgi:hypothetical protein